MAAALSCPIGSSASGAEQIEDVVDCPVSDDDEISTYDFGTDSDLDDEDIGTICPGQRFTEEEQKKIKQKWIDGYINSCGEYARLYNESRRNEDEKYSLLPPMPLKVLPETTSLCIKRGYCYHREYMTHDTYETSQSVGFEEPDDMLQVFSLTLSHAESYPISVYGIFAIRDDLEPLRNYVFNRTRDDPVVIDKDSFALPLCSPCRGIYVLDHALLEVDLWMKKEGDRSTDEQLLSVYVEIESRSRSYQKLDGRIHGDHCGLDMSYTFLTYSVEATIQVSALADNPSNVRFIAFSSYFHDEIILFKGKGIMKGELFRHVVAVKANEKLGVRLELGNSVYEWMFQDGVSSSADDLTMNQFHVGVFFAPKTTTSRISRYLDWKKKM